MPFEKGKSGNPAGRPKKGESLADLVAELGERRKQIKVSGKKKMEPLIKIVVLKMYDLAMSGDVAAAKFLADRRDGKAVAPVELQNPDGSDLFNYEAKLDNVK